jgi:hypothetical protein
MQSAAQHEQLSYTLFGVFAPSFSLLRHLHPAGAPNLGESLEVPQHLEDSMRSITSIVLPIILAVGVSGLMFTATLV